MKNTGKHWLRFLVLVGLLILLNFLPTLRKSTNNMESFASGPFRIHHENSLETAQFIETVAEDGVEKFTSAFPDATLPTMDLYIFNNQARMQRQKYGLLTPLIPGLDHYIADIQGQKIMLVSLDALPEGSGFHHLAGSFSHVTGQVLLRSINPNLPFFIEEGAINYLQGRPQAKILTENIPSLDQIQNIAIWDTLSFYEGDGPLYAYTFFEFLDEAYPHFDLKDLVYSGSVEETYAISLGDLYSDWVEWLQNEPAYVRDHYLPEAGGKILLYGEYHGNDEVRQLELEAWKGHYAGGARHLFIESDYAWGQLLNAWMQSEDGEEEVGLKELITDHIQSTPYYSPYELEMLQTIKSECPETVFHATDVGHSVALAEDYLAYLEDKSLTEIPAYQRTMENLAQGDHYYQLIQTGQLDEAEAYREKNMVENFVWTYDPLEEEKIMGVYGDYHASPLDSRSLAGGVEPVMAVQLAERYGDVIAYRNMERLVKGTQ